MPQPAIRGVYLGVQSLKARIGYKATGEDDIILRHLDAASRSFEQEVRRVFFPYRATNAYRWPSFYPQATWSLWTDQDLLAVHTLTAAASGSSPVGITDYYLEPQPFGPPYNRIEVNLSKAGVYQSGPTPQRSVAVDGDWGYSADTVSAGTVSGLSDASVTGCTVSDASLVDTGDLLLIEEEQLYVSDGGTLTPTVERGANGTTAAAHADDTPILKYVAPADVRNVVAAEAIWTFSQEQRGYEFAIGAGDAAIAYGGRTPEADYRARICAHYTRRRVGTV